MPPHGTMRVQDELAGGPLVEISVARRRVLQADDRRVHRFGDL